MAGQPGGFDFNQWQQMQASQSGQHGGSTPPWISMFFKFFGIYPNIEGHGVIGDTNVGGGLSLQNAAVVKERPGGVLASILKYFVRELPAGLLNGSEGGGEGGGAAAGGAVAHEGGGGSPSDMPAFASVGGAPAHESVEYGGKLISAGVSEGISVSMERLGSLASNAPDMGGGREGPGAGMAA